MKKDKWNQAADCLKIISHPHRLEILNLIAEKRCSVGELAKSLNLLPHVTSEHLSLLKLHGLISSQREGRKIFYTIKEPAILSILKCIKNRFFEE